jgi:hypothetical protein
VAEVIPGWAWLAWFFGTVAVFVVLEARALSNGPSQDALTHNLRCWFRVHTRAGALAFLGFLSGFGFLLLWLAAHVITARL